MFLLIMGNEDGNPISKLSEEELRDLLRNPDEWGINSFITELPPEGWETDYWPDGVAMVLRASPLNVRQLKDFKHGNS